MFAPTRSQRGPNRYFPCQGVGLAMSTTTMMIIIATLSLASATGQYGVNTKRRPRPTAGLAERQARLAHTLPRRRRRRATFHHVSRIICQFWVLPRLGRRTAFAGRGVRRGRRTSQQILAAPRGALPVHVGAHARLAPIWRRRFHRERRGGQRAVAREDPGGGERGLPLVH